MFFLYLQSSVIALQIFRPTGGLEHQLKVSVNVLPHGGVRLKQAGVRVHQEQRVVKDLLDLVAKIIRELKSGANCPSTDMLLQNASLYLCLK